MKPQKRKNLESGESSLIPSPEESTPEKLYDGCWICGNVWIKIGLSFEQAKQLKAFSKTFFNPKYQGSAKACRYLVSAALSHIEIVEKLLRADLEAEIKEEGMSKDGEIVWQRKAKAKLGQWN